jgi:thioredoxin 1
MARRDASYRIEVPDLADVLARRGWTLLDFGTDWCGHCRAALPAVDAWLALRTDIDHLRVEDGPGRALGRSFRIKLWPTLVLLRDGLEIARVVRPRALADLAALGALPQ